jgi:flagellar hook assembly protein FlgD
LRRALIAALSLVLVLLAVPVAPALAGSSTKVVVIVGPVGSLTAHYKADANAIAAEARRYTSDVIKIFTPDATWAKVKAAAQGANILVYLGHGNGWPSVHGPFQTVTKDGLGLDPGTGADSTRTVYYGEDYIRGSIRLAPNAVVLLYHLCYASGNTEPGYATGSFSDARLRVDNYGAGFIGAGARAVFAEGHPAHPATYYLRQLFTTNRTMESVFRAGPTAHRNVLGPYDSQRIPGLRFLLDPDSPTPTGFYRSLIGDLSLTASQVVAPGLVRTDRQPADFVIPGAAEVVAGDGAGIFTTADAAADPAAKPSTTLKSGTRLRVTDEAAAAHDATRILAARVVAGSTKGFVRATALVPRDSAPVDAWTLDQSGPWLSPNGDNVSDGFVVAARFTESAAAALTIKNAAGKTVKTLSSTGEIARFAWNLKSADGAPIADGAYTWVLRAADAWANEPLTRSGTFTVDGTPPVSRAESEATGGDNGWLVSPAVVTLTAKDALSGVRSIAWRLAGGTATTYSKPVRITANGTQTLQFRATDKAGVREAWKSVELKIDTDAPVVTLVPSGTAGDAAGTWRGPVTISASIKDAVSGVAAKRFSLDDGEPAALGADPVVVKGDGPHTISVTATDKAGNKRSATLDVTIDTTAPSIKLPDAGEGVPTVTPNGDHGGEQVAFPYSASEPGSVAAVVTAADATVVRTITSSIAEGENRLAWDGRTDAGAPAPDGRYTVTLTPRDRAGNVGKPVSLEVDVYAALKALTRTPTAFFPQDADSLAPRTTASFTLLAPASVTITVVDGSGTVVRTGPVDKALPAGPATWAWNGKNDAGTFAPRGSYRIVVAATNGTQRAVQRASVLADAFRLSTSTATAIPGTALTVTAVTAEPLATTPRVVIRQPGLDPRTITMTKKGSSTWTAVVTPKKGGAPGGTLTLVVKATDTKGGANASTVRLALQ